MESHDPCQNLGYEYTDAINELEEAKKKLEKIQSGKTSENVDSIGETEAKKRLEKARNVLNHKRKELEECQERHQSFYSEAIKKVEN